jgi:hypothetical protein
VSIYTSKSTFPRRFNAERYLTPVGCKKSGKNYFPFFVFFRKIIFTFIDEIDEAFFVVVGDDSSSSRHCCPSVSSFKMAMYLSTDAGSPARFSAKENTRQ